MRLFSKRLQDSIRGRREKVRLITATDVTSPRKSGSGELEAKTTEGFRVYLKKD